MHDHVRQQLRTKLGRPEESTVAIADSQSVKTTEKGVAGAWRLPPGKEATLRGGVRLRWWQKG